MDLTRLIPTNLLDETFDPTAEQDTQLSQLRELDIDAVMADPGQPDVLVKAALTGLSRCRSLSAGVVQPIVVTPERDGTYWRSWLVSAVGALRKWQDSSRSRLSCEA